MALPTNDLEWLTALTIRHEAELPQLQELDNEYNLQGTRPYMHPDIQRELEGRLQHVCIAWPELVVGALEERLDVEGFRLPDQDNDDDLWRVWQANEGDEESQMAHLDALVMKRSYICVGANEDDADTPLVTFESPTQMFADVDPRNRKIRAAVRRWTDFQDSLVRLPEQYATLYLPNRTVHYEWSGPGAWHETGRDEHNLGTVPVVPVVNRSRLDERYGRSELARILPLVRSANQIATNMMVAAEFVAMPLRGIFGAGPDALEDKDGNKLTAMQAMMGRLLMIPGEIGDLRQFEFASAQLANFTTVLDKLGELAGSISGLPAHYMGKATDNPPSADSIRSNEARLVKRAERRQRGFGGSDEKAMRLVRRFQEGDWDPKLQRLETVWRDASTPTIAQKADAAVKTHAEGITTTRQARVDLGYTAAQIAAMEADDEKQDARQAARFKLPTAAEQVSAQPVAAVAGATG